MSELCEVCDKPIVTDLEDEERDGDEICRRSKPYCTNKAFAVNWRALAKYHEATLARMKELNTFVTQHALLGRQSAVARYDVDGSFRNQLFREIHMAIHGGELPAWWIQFQEELKR